MELTEESESIVIFRIGRPDACQCLVKRLRQTGILFFQINPWNIWKSNIDGQGIPAWTAKSLCTCHWPGNPKRPTLNVPLRSSNRSSSCPSKFFCVSNLKSYISPSLTAFGKINVLLTRRIAFRCMTCVRSKWRRLSRFAGRTAPCTGWTNRRVNLLASRDGKQSRRQPSYFFF